MARRHVAISFKIKTNTIEGKSGQGRIECGTSADKTIAPSTTAALKDYYNKPVSQMVVALLCLPELVRLALMEHNNSDLFTKAL